MSRSFLLSARTRFSLSLSLRIFGFGRAMGPFTRKLLGALHLFCSEEAIASADRALFCLEVFKDFLDLGMAVLADGRTAGGVRYPAGCPIRRALGCEWRVIASRCHGIRSVHVYMSKG